MNDRATDLANCRRQPPDFGSHVDTVIVGTKFRGDKAIDALRRLEVGQEIRLEREQHPKDLNAIRCHAFGLFIGYVPKVANSRPAAAMDGGAEATATVTAKAEVYRSGFIKTEPKIRVSWA